MHARGASHIVLISPDSKNSVTLDRLDGFYSAFSEAPPPSFHPYKLMIDLEVRDPREKEEIIREFIGNHPLVDGFFFASTANCPSCCRTCWDAIFRTIWRTVCFAASTPPICPTSPGSGRIPRRSPAWPCST